MSAAFLKNLIRGVSALFLSSHSAVPSVEQLSTMINSISSKDWLSTESTASGRNAPPFRTGMHTLTLGDIILAAEPGRGSPATLPLISPPCQVRDENTRLSCRWPAG